MEKSLILHHKSFILKCVMPLHIECGEHWSPGVFSSQSIFFYLEQRKNDILLHQMFNDDLCNLDAECCDEECTDFTMFFLFFCKHFFG